MACKPRRGKWPEWVLLAPLIVLGVVSAPWVGAVMPACLFHQKTGLHCPGCGATRSALALGEGRVSDALHFNALFVIGVIGGGGWLVLSAARLRYPTVGWLGVCQWRLWFLWVVLGLVVVFAITRNIPGFEWLAPGTIPVRVV